MHHIQSTTDRSKIIVGLALGTGAIATTGCGAPQPASLENSGMGGLDYSELDYSKLDYSKLDYSKLDPQQMADCSPKMFKASELEDELQVRLSTSLNWAIEKKMDKAIISQIKKTKEALVATEHVLIEHDLCW